MKGKFLMSYKSRKYRMCLILNVSAVEASKVKKLVKLFLTTTTSKYLQNKINIKTWTINYKVEIKCNKVQ